VRDAGRGIARARRVVAVGAASLLVSAGRPSGPAVDRWYRAAAGLEWSERVLTDGESAGPVRVVAVRVDPTRFHFALEAAISPGGTTPEWTIDDAGAPAVLALNAGQFIGAAPWGWVVHHGREARPPGTGPLSTAVVFDHEGRVRLLDPGELVAARDSRVAEEAIQSYPTLLRGHAEIPPQLTHEGLGVDIGHRDSRLAVGVLDDGRLLIVLTRYARFGSALADVPLGPTVGEMAALMQRLGCQRAVSLDGGISSQLFFRDSSGTAHTWRGWRTVPLGLVATARSDPKG
jgi:exopolysaccharide biosynthesis protein